MSMPPNDPFETNPNSRFATPQSTPSESNTWKWVLGIILGVCVVGGLVCCGGIYFMFNMGKGMMADMVKQEMSANPVIQEHIGEIQSIELNLAATGEAGQDKPGVLAFDLVGSKGSGVLEIKQDRNQSGEAMTIHSAELVMPDGTRYEVMSDLDSFEDQIDTGIEIDAGSAELDHSESEILLK
ncbi:cytochrome c oxidase assembly factor Coa1 family protein [Novipirellula caenicola]|uniref:Cytochrome oxidase complex assembly protein 1 n=1 Tax=Novipirellula caenicola TaxID=1536901 RepID=A0ABP9VZH9_9BACT